MQSLHLSSAGVLLGPILVSGWGVLFLLYQVIKQQGRLLLRLDGIEQLLVALEDFRGKKLLLVNWSPQCGFCIRIAPIFAQLQQAFQAHNVELALASFGDAGPPASSAGRPASRGSSPPVRSP